MSIPSAQRADVPIELVVVGELNVDLILDQVNALPALEKERLARGMTLTLGSSSAILASNASALGLATGFVGRVGVDAFGAFVVERLRARGIDTRYVLETEGVQTGLTAIYTFGAQRGAMTYPGAMEQLTLEDVPWDYVARAKHLHVSSYYLQPGLRPGCPELFRRAKALGLSTSFDTNWDPAEAWGDDIFDVLANVDVFLPNDDEALRISDEQDLDRAMVELVRHADAVVVTCGRDGVRARRGDETWHLPAVPVEPVDAVGAGDSFNAGFLARYVRGGTFPSCLHAGLVSGAFSTTRAGGTAAFDNREAYDRFAADAQAAPAVL